MEQPEGGEREGAIAKALPELRFIKSTVEQFTTGAAMDACVQLAWEAFHSLYRDNILDLINKFPEDAKTSRSE